LLAVFLTRRLAQSGMNRNVCFLSGYEGFLPKPISIARSQGQC